MRRAEKRNKMLRNKKVLGIILAVVIAAYFVIVNTCFPNYSGTFVMDNVFSWSEIVSTEVKEGDANKLKIELKGDNKIKVVYDGPFDLSAVVKIRDITGKTIPYELRIFEKLSTINDGMEVDSVFLKIE